MGLPEISVSISLAKKMAALSQTLLAGNDLSQMLEEALALCAEILGVDRAAVEILDRAAGHFRTAATYGWPAEISWTLTWDEEGLSNGVSYVAKSQKPIFITEEEREMRFGVPDFIRQTGVRSTLIVPMALPNRNVVGTVAFNTISVRNFSEEEVEVAVSLANSIAQALDRRWLLENTQRQLAEISVLHQITDICAQSMEQDSLIEAVTNIIGSALFVDNCGVLLFDSTTEQLVTHPSYRAAGGQLDDRIALSLDTGICGYVYTTGNMVNVPDTTQNAYFQSSGASMYSELCAPIQNKGQIFGVINAESQHLHTFNEKDERLLGTVATSLAIALERIRSFDKEKQRVQESRILQSAASALMRSVEMEQVLDEILVQLRQVITFESATILLAQNHQLAVMAAHGLPALELALNSTFPDDETFYREVKRTHRPVILTDASQDSRFHGWANTGYVRGWMGVPLLLQDECIGYITIDSRQAGAYTEKEAALVMPYAAQAAAAIQNALLFRQLDAAKEAAEIASRCVEALNQAPTILDAFPEILSGLAELTHCQTGSLLLPIKNGPMQIETLDTRDGVRTNHTEFLINQTNLEALSQLEKTIDLAQFNPSPWRDHLTAQGIRSVLPLIIDAQPRFRGAVILGWRNEDPLLTQTSWQTLKRIAEAIGLVAIKGDLLEQATQRAGEMAVLFNLSQLLRITHYSTQVLRVVMDEGATLLGGSHGAILLYDEEADRLYIQESTNWPEMLRDVSYHAQNSLVGHVFSNRTPYYTSNLSADPHLQWSELASQIAEWKNASAICAPLQVEEKVIGVMLIVNLPNHTFSAEDLHLLAAITEIASSALHRARIMETLEQRVADRTSELAEANQRLQVLDQLKSEFVSNVSHELRTPLTNIKLYAGLLRRATGEKISAYLDVLETEVDHLHRLIESVLDLSKLDTDPAPLQHHFTPFSLDDLCQRVVTQAMSKARNRNITLSYQSPDPPVTVMGHPVQIGQAITNLVENALNYTQAGGEVTIRVENHLTSAVIHVIDTGMGIDEAEQSRLFERFFRGGRAAAINMPGAGLGLSIVQKIVRQHGGHIEFSSQIDQGSTFSITLPI